MLIGKYGEEKRKEVEEIDGKWYEENGGKSRGKELSGSIGLRRPILNCWDRMQRRIRSW